MKLEIERWDNRNIFDLQELQRRCNTLISLIEKEMADVIVEKPAPTPATAKGKKVSNRESPG